MLDLQFFLILQIYSLCLDDRAASSPTVLFGRPFQASVFVKPPLQDFVWPNHLLCSNMDDDQISSMLVPNPPAQTPDKSGYHYPEAVSHRLLKTNTYLRGLVYTSEFDSSTRDGLKTRLLITKTPPNIHPCHLDGMYTWDPIPGMIELPSGIPFAQVPVDERDHLITIACFHTIDSLKQFPAQNGGTVGDAVQEITNKLLVETFGSATNNEHSAVYKIPGLKPNYRSPKTGPDSHDGSYSLAFTKIEGGGRGHFTVATQVVHPQRTRILVLNHQLYRLIMPCCISKLEWDMMEFNAQDNNVPSFGGSESGATSLQLNVSSDRGTLAEMIGNIQGALHTDQNDYLGSFTLVVMLFRLPPGKFYLS
jgi:hypothetical protein